MSQSIDNSSPTIIAEIGCTHIGNMDRAKHLIYLAKSSGADVVKTQKRCPKESTPQRWWDKPHPNQRFSYGKTYLEHRENLEFTIEQHEKLKEYCEDIGIIYSTSVWDMTSLKEVIDIDPKMIKIPSACNHRYDMMNYLYQNFKGDVHISLGMTDFEERHNIWKYLVDNKNLTDADRRRTVIYHCTSGYPVPFESIYLLEISNLYDWIYSLHEDGRMHIGFSNHGYGIVLEPAAYALGARYFERHFIDDRVFDHTDAAFSLEPGGIQKLCRDLKAVQKAFTEKPHGLDPLEKEQREKLRNG